MANRHIKPDYVFESSWEVCNKVGGIYTVESTRAKSMTELMGDNLMFIGPDVWREKPCPYLKEDDSLLAGWKAAAKQEGIKVKTGRWDIPGEPIAVLVDFLPYFEKKNYIYGRAWEKYGVDSLHAYGDYDEVSMFSYAAGLVVESYCHYALNEEKRVIYHANEWMTGLGMLYVKSRLPWVGTVFTTHATSIGRSIAGNMKPLYDYLFAYNGDQMAWELNMQSKHSIEKQAAWNADCFTTVSEITARECAELLDKKVDVVLPNGFDDSFVPPTAAVFKQKRAAARKKLIAVANALLGEHLDDDTLIVSTSGRYEFRNKGVDVYIEAMNRLLRDKNLKRNVLAFIEVPGWVGEPRQDLKERLESGKTYDEPLQVPQLTHWLRNMSQDNVLGMMKHYDMHNRKDDKAKVVFLPCYLDGKDGIIDMTYYDVVLGNDLCIYPSYYEPWGYTPLEAIAFNVPCITTDLAGFGRWVNGEVGHEGRLEDGVKVIHRTDYNYSEVADVIKDTVSEFSAMGAQEVEQCRKAAGRLSKKALWSEFMPHYRDAYDMALGKARARMEEREQKEKGE